MKKTATVLLAIILLLFTSCGNTAADDGKLHIVTTVFAEYDWVKNIAAGNDDVEITLLLDNGVDLHSYQPTAEDILNITESDLFIFVGGESDEWAENLLKTNSKVNALNLLDSLGESVLEEEIVEGMEDAEEESEEDEEHAEYDEHIWLSLNNAEAVCKIICEKLCEIDGDNASLYQNNAEAYENKLKALDEEYRQTVEASSIKTLVFGDRFPFRYLTEDYGLSYYAAFVGCSAESEASFETIKFLSEKLDELKLKKIITLEGSETKLAETIIANTADKDAEILKLNSMQSITGNDVDNGADYIEIMRDNLNTLKAALS